MDRLSFPLLWDPSVWSFVCLIYDNLALDHCVFFVLIKMCLYDFK